MISNNQLMIKFFRHIRKSLLMENNTTKYLKYALGEIILVVIGILIALQINNKNDERKAEERTSEVFTAGQQHHLTFHGMLNRPIAQLTI